jgi:hypothetical protein
MNQDLFDSYGRQARLVPALLVLLPAAVAALMWAPKAYTLGGQIVALGMTFGGTVVLAHLARDRGKSVEPRLFQLWGGMPTTALLRFSDKAIDYQTKARYHSLFAQRISAWIRPSAQDEQTDGAACDLRYATAVDWLRARTRDRQKFPLVFRENVNYGFRRNTYALRWYGVAVAAAAVTINVARLDLTPLPDWADDEQLRAASGAALSLLASIFWLFVVTPRWVRAAAESYSRALLSACDSEHLGPV